MNASARFHRIDARELPAWLAARPEVLVLDAREAPHHAEGHLAGSLRLDGRNHERLLMTEAKSRPVFIYCYHGNASRVYAQMFVDFGFQEVADLIGGWAAWSPPAAARVGAAAPIAAATPAATASEAETAPPASASTPVPAGAHGNTPLMEAAWRGQSDRVRALVEQGADLAAVNGDGNNALWLACVSDDADLVRWLARAGVPLDHQNLTGASCLMYAASSGKPEIVRALLELGADARLQTQDDYTALDMAATVECLQLLRAATRLQP